MAYQSLGKFKCDGCKVIESDEIDLPSDNLRAVPPKNWLRAELVRQRGELTIFEIRHFCPTCAPLVESYLSGRIPSDVGDA